jgi:ABC-type phosphate transport system substrate-binding protein
MQMHSHFLNRHAAGAVAAMALALSVASEARAQTVPDCSTLTSPVYVTGSSALKPFLAKAAAKLLPNITVVYLSAGSCAGVASMTTAPAGTINTAGAVFWDTNAVAVPGGCNLDPAGTTVDIGASDVFAGTCGTPVAAGVTDTHGPIQIMTMAMPVGATATNVISAEAAYMVYGFAADTAPHTVAPWSDPTAIFQRNGGSGTQNMIATAIKVPAAKWKGGTNAASGDVYNSMIAAAGAGKTANTIGILATDYVDLHRDTVKALAYQHYGQTCGYLPDSSATSFDKVNVRDGHYMIWGPLHLYSQGTPSASVKKVLDALSLKSDDATNTTMIQTEAKAGDVPDCAMHVSRTSEIGPLASYDPAVGCECKFLFEATGAVPSDCKACTDANKATVCTTAAGARGTACNFGYCEAH